MAEFPREVETFENKLTAMLMTRKPAGIYPALLRIPGGEPVKVFVYGAVQPQGDGNLSAAPLAIVWTPELNALLDIRPAQE